MLWMILSYQIILTINLTLRTLYEIYYLSQHCKTISFVTVFNSKPLSPASWIFSNRLLAALCLASILFRAIPEAGWR